MIYLNQAATTFPKPKQVMDAVSDAIANPPQGQFRSSAASEDIFDICRKNLGKLFGVENYQNIYFTSGATAGANWLFYGLSFPNKKVVVSQTEHNSILRPAMNLEGRIKEVLVLTCDEIGRLNPDDLDELLKAQKDKVDAVFINHCSNVTGVIQDLPELTKVAHFHGALLVADFSQSAGCIPISVDEWGVDAFIFAGHKGLFGIQGTGGFYARPGVALKPFMYGGTGRDSTIVKYNEDFEYEVGTANGPGIAGLNAGVRYILDIGVENIRIYELELMDRLYSGLKEIQGVHFFEVPETIRGPVLSFIMDGMKPSDIAYILQNGYEITVRTGLHCAPFIHEAMGIKETGTVRISVSYLNTKEDIDAVISAVKDIAASL